MGKCAVKALGGGPQIYQTEDFELVDKTSMRVRLPGGHVFSDFSHLAVSVYANPSFISYLKVSDTTIQGGGYGKDHAVVFGFGQGDIVDANATVLDVGGYTSNYGTKLYSAFGILK